MLSILFFKNFSGERLCPFFYGQRDPHDQERTGVESAQDGPRGRKGKELGKKDLNQEDREEREEGSEDDVGITKIQEIQGEASNNECGS